MNIVQTTNHANKTSYMGEQENRETPLTPQSIRMLRMAGSGKKLNFQAMVRQRLLLYRRLLIDSFMILSNIASHTFIPAKLI